MTFEAESHPAQLWYDRDDQIDALAVDQPTPDGDHHDSGFARIRPVKIRREYVRIDGVGDDRDLVLGHVRPQDGVALAHVGHANAVIRVGQRVLEEGVGDDRRGVLEPEQRVIREHRGQVEQRGHEKGLVGQRREGRMAVHDVDLLPAENPFHDRKRSDDRRQDGFVVERNNRQVVDFESVGHEADSGSVSVEVRDDDHAVTFLDEALGQLEQVGLDAAHVRVEKVRHEANPHRCCCCCCCE